METAAEKVMKNPGNQRRAAKRVLVVGAGVAGLYAAHLLAGRGYHPTVVEALDRVGGKILGGNIAGFPFDFGAQGFSERMKRVESVGRSLGLTRIKRPEAGEFFLGEDAFHTEGAYELVRAERLAFDEKAAHLFSHLTSSSRREEYQAISVMDLARGHFSERGLAYFRTNFASEWCSLPEEVSLLHYLEIQRVFEGDEADEMAFRYREGFFAFATRLAYQLGNRVLLNTAIDGVQVYERGITATAGSTVFEADAVVLAVPLLQLRKISFRGFDATQLLDALSSYRACSARKVVAVYESPFWEGKARDGEFSLPCGMSMLDNSDLEKGIYSLAIFLGGPAAQENPGREAVLARVAQVLGPAAKLPTAYHEEAWLETDYLSGGYAANRAPSRGGFGVLPTELAGRIFLAGSETAHHFPTYVEGALASAERAANLAAAIFGREFVLA